MQLGCHLLILLDSKFQGELWPGGSSLEEWGRLMLQQNKAGDAHTKLPVPALPSCCTIPAPRCSCPPVLPPGPKFPFPPASSLSCRPAGDAVSSSRAGGLELVVSWDCLLRREPRESPVSCRTRQECHTGILVVKGP